MAGATATGTGAAAASAAGAPTRIDSASVAQALAPCCQVAGRALVLGSDAVAKLPGSAGCQ